jgi:hypothetical protein
MNSVVKKISFVVLIGLAVFFLFFFDFLFFVDGGQDVKQEVKCDVESTR